MLIELSCPLGGCDGSVLLDQDERREVASCAAGHELDVDWSELQAWEHDESIWVPACAPSASVRGLTDD